MMFDAIDKLSPAVIKQYGFVTRDEHQERMRVMQHLRRHYTFSHAKTMFLWLALPNLCYALYAYICVQNGASPLYMTHQAHGSLACPLLGGLLGLIYWGTLGACPFKTTLAAMALFYKRDFPFRLSLSERLGMVLCCWGLKESSCATIYMMADHLIESGNNIRFKLPDSLFFGFDAHGTKDYHDKMNAIMKIYAAEAGIDPAPEEQMAPVARPHDDGTPSQRGLTVRLGGLNAMDRL